MKTEALRGHEAAAPDVRADRAPLEDAELVRRVQKGDNEAFNLLVLRHQNMVYSLCCRFMRDATQAEDMAQEAFVKAFRLLNNFRGDCAFSTWLYRVTSSVCLTELNRRNRRNEVSLEAQHLDHLQAEPRIESDLFAHIRRCIGGLSERYQQIVAMYYLEERSYEDIAGELEIPLGTLKTWMFRARKQLRKIVERELKLEAP